MMSHEFSQPDKSQHVVSRRGLLRGFIGKRHEQATRNDECLHRSEQISDAKRLRARPPFAAPEQWLQALCNGCQNCVQACSYNLIQLDMDNKPTLNIDYLACNMCQDCAQSCPTNALHSAFKADTELRVHFNYHCLINHRQQCQTCIESCPQQAIANIDNTLVVDENLCNGCGECKVACFAGGIELSLKV